MFERIKNLFRKKKLEEKKRVEPVVPKLSTTSSPDYAYRGRPSATFDDLPYSTGHTHRRVHESSPVVGSTPSSSTDTTRDMTFGAILGSVLGGDSDPTPVVASVSTPIHSHKSSDDSYTSSASSSKRSDDSYTSTASDSSPNHWWSGSSSSSSSSWGGDSSSSSSSSDYSSSSSDSGSSWSD